jgi:hypothetical protein
MAKNGYFEIYSFKGGVWLLDSVHDDKNMAIHQGRMLIASPHHMAISVIEESDDGVTDNTMSKIIYKEKKGEGDEKPKKRTKEKVKHKKMKGKELKKKKVNLMLLVISFGSVGLGLLARLALLMAEFGEPVII